MLKNSTVSQLLNDAGEALDVATELQQRARLRLEGIVAPDGEVRPDLLEKHQFAIHGFAWQATCVEALRQAFDWATRLKAGGRFQAASA